MHPSKMSRNSAGSNPNLHNLVRAASHLQEQVRSAVQRLEQSTNTPCEDSELQGTSQGRQGGGTAEWTTGLGGQRAGRTPTTATSTAAAVPATSRMNYTGSATAGHFSGEL